MVEFLKWQDVLLIKCDLNSSQALIFSDSMKEQETFCMTAS